MEQTAKERFNNCCNYLKEHANDPTKVGSVKKVKERMEELKREVRDETLKCILSES